MPEISVRWELAMLLAGIASNVGVGLLGKYPRARLGLGLFGVACVLGAVGLVLWPTSGEASWRAGLYGVAGLSLLYVYWDAFTRLKKADKARSRAEGNLGRVEMLAEQYRRDADLWRKQYEHEERCQWTTQDVIPGFHEIKPRRMGEPSGLQATARGWKDTDPIRLRFWFSEEVEVHFARFVLHSERGKPPDGVFDAETSVSEGGRVDVSYRHPTKMGDEGALGTSRVEVVVFPKEPENSVRLLSVERRYQFS